MTVNKEALQIAIDALERQMPKKPYNEVKSYSCYRCACCGHVIEYLQNYCDHCGQAIDWTEDK